MEDVELFLAPLTARSKIREVLRGLVATRQVHTISFGHAPHYYVAGTLPEFTVAPNIYASSAMASSSYFGSGRFEEETPFVPERRPAPSQARPAPSQVRPAPPQVLPAAPAPQITAKDASLPPAANKPASNGKSAQARPHFSRPASHSRDRKRSQTSSNRLARRPSRDSRTAPSRSASSRTSSASRWAKPNNNGRSNGNSNHSGSRSGSVNGNHASRNGSGLHNGHASNGNGKATPQSRVKRSGHGSNGKMVGKPATSARSSASRKEVRVDARSRKPALTAGAKAGNSKRYGFTAPARRRTKKRG
jgi:hypothetical protein